ncbi:type I polyketide synthase [Actinomadura sp. DC4]|uniref:type I polyketide synthase n=1 Tax=Actinomadura sp. DC4 TaxID=3055069 RepID=UPI0025AFA821|nr:type I polyketide synthase [Actinomadura sp. DC4]MDN3355697.1 beta-ketoacyl synthase N-terminal-like domain-containing protein [Actinomadura sp. DC4]
MARARPEVPSAGAAPIAVIGLACRLPNAPDPAAFWRLLSHGESAIGEMPADRGRAAPAPGDDGAPRVWPGGFLDDVASFDAEFFGISPREAVSMDPQQRLVLELTWEALEDAGIRPPSLAGSDTGVFVGAIWNDYATLLRRSSLGGSARHAMTGMHRSIIANRVSYGYDLRGPSLHIDTAQSSSLVAVHVASESLRRGECSLALAGGINLILDEDSMEMAAQFGGLSPDGRCYTFDARANGFVRGEGGGVVLLKPLDAALRDGDPVYCVILGGAMNNDGSTDALTVPSTAAQEHVLREAYRAAGVSPADVQYVELHGSGTPVGDPVEAAALGAVLGAGRDAPLPVGSVKTNIGHLEGAGGIAGLIKTALSLRHERLPQSLNFSTPNPKIPLDRLGLRVQDRLTGWPYPDRPLLAGVSSFGMGGTNCHLLLGAAPEEPVAGATRSGDTADVPWPLSGTSRAALAAQAGRLRRHLAEHPDLDPADVGYSLGTSRSAFACRAVVLGENAEERLDRLAALERGDDAAGPGDGGVALLFSGPGSERARTGQALYEAHPRFAQALDDVWAELDPHLERPLREVTFAGDGPLDQAPYAHAAVFALDVALYRLAESWGLGADVVMGHSAGEVAAAHVAGALPLAEACALVVALGRLAQDAEGALDELRTVVSDLTVSALAVPVVSGVTGRPVTVGRLGSADHWAECVRESGGLAAGLDFLREGGAGVFLELGHGERLAAMARDHVAAGPGPVVLAALEGDRPESAAFAAAMAGAYVQGADLDWEQVFAGRECRRIGLPTYAFQRSRYWPDALPAPTTTTTPAPAAADREAPARAPGEGSPFTRRLAALNDADRDRALLETVLTHVAVVLGHATPAAVDPRLTFKQLGFDSIAGTELSQRLGTATQLPLPTTLTFDHPTPHAVAGHLRDRVLRAPAAPADGPGHGTADDAIAIVGMACRYPGAGSPEELWDLVAGEEDAVGAFPANRGWDLSALFDEDPDRSGCSYTREGGFLYDADLFDAAFFGISPREAVAMDPQQRLLLETAWQAFERTGVDAGSLRRSATGVFVGATTQDYGPRMHEASQDLDGQLLTGTTPSVMAGRLAFSFGLEGPAMTVDTACSSSLVAMHLACQSLRQGECSLALAGGITVMATPGMFVEFSRQRGLSPDGRCKAFSKAADGTGWAEGVGLVVLERLSDAERNGHRILAIVRGSAINQDGASNGLTAPNGPSQERVIRRALANARLAAADVDVIEAHGTGTTLGDPIEANALLATYGQGRRQDRPLWLGTVKSNIGHTQAAAGVAGVIKMVMALRHGVLPTTLHVDEPSPHVDWSAGEVRLLTEAVDWPENGRPRRAGVSSFGISGTNAHLIVEQAPDHRGSEPTAPLWVLSARSAQALRAQAERLAEHVTARPELTSAEVGWSLIRTRSVFEHRAAVIGQDRGRLLAGLAALAEDAPDADVVTGAAGAAGADPVLVFPGQGSQWAGMGAELLDSSPVFAARAAECERALAPYVDWSLTRVLRGDGAELSRVDVVQPALWAVMVSLAALWAEYGVRPAAVIGHSQGEIAAACVAGALSIEDAARIVAVRSQALRSLSGGGAMASLRATEADVRRLLEQVDGVAVAAVNSPSATVISGPPEPVKAVVAAAEEQGLRARLIDVDYASHGPQVDEITEELGVALEGIAPMAATVPFYSTVTAERIDTTTLDAGYWVTNLREQVRFADTVAALLADGHRVFVESSPNPVLTPGIGECAEEADTTAAALPTIRRDQGGPAQVIRALAGAFAAGVDVDWTRCFPTDPPPTVVDLPTYAFQRESYWLSVTRGGADAVNPSDLGLSGTGHPVLGAAFDPAGGVGRVLTGRVSGRRQPWLTDHVIADTLLVPGAAQLEWALRAADETGCATVEELVIHTPLAVPEPSGLSVQVVVGAAGEDGRREVGVYSRADAGWTCHATGVLGAVPTGPGEPPAAAWPPAGAEPVDLAGFYDRTAAAGYGYGPVFQGLRAMWRDGADLLAEVELPEAEAEEFGVHPALLDAVLHPLLVGRLGDEGVWLPFTWNEVVLHAAGATSVRVRLSPLGDALDHGVRLTVTDPAGGPVLDAVVTLRQADGERLQAAGERARTDDGPANGGPVRRPVAAAANGGRSADLAGRLAGLAKEERRRMVLDLVRGHSAAVLGHADAARVSPEATFTELGLGSVMAVELRDRLVSATGLALPAALIFGHPTPKDVAGELLRRAATGGGTARRGQAGPLLGEVARLESALAAVDAADGDHDAVAARLERLLDTWKEARRAAKENGAGPGAGEDADAADRLRSASTEQVLDFIDKELGAS